MSKRPVERPAASPVLEASSALRLRAMELYRARLPRDWSPDRWNDAIWSDSWRQARIEILGDES